MLSNINFIGLVFYSFFTIGWSFSNNWEKGVMGFKIGFTLDSSQFELFKSAMRGYRNVGTLVLIIYHVLYFFRTDWWVTFLIFGYGVVFSASILTILQTFNISINSSKNIVGYCYLAAIGMFYFLP